ncbi:MAG: P-loop NTPase, partial [bacterium]
ENMSTFVCPHCGEKTDIFDSDGGKRIAERTSTELLGQIPLDPKVRADGDGGKPIVKSDIDSPVAQAFLEVADRIIEKFPIMSK